MKEKFEKPLKKEGFDEIIKISSKDIEADPCEI